MFKVNYNAKKTPQVGLNLLKPFKPSLVYAVFRKTNGFYLKVASKVAKIGLKSLLEGAEAVYT